MSGLCNTASSEASHYHVINNQVNIRIYHLILMLFVGNVSKTDVICGKCVKNSVN